jgi:hypothetical protein
MLNPLFLNGVREVSQKRGFLRTKRWTAGNCLGAAGDQLCNGRTPLDRRLFPGAFWDLAITALRVFLHEEKSR